MLKSIGDFFFAQRNHQSAAEATQQELFPKAPNHRLVIVGGAGGGKTTLFNRLHLGRIEPNTITSFTGVNFEQLTIQGEEFTVCDVAGAWSTRSLWGRFVEGAAGIICVVNSADEAQIEETKEWLWRMCQEYSYRETPLLVFANKQDRLNAMPVKEVMNKLELETRAGGRRWHIQGSIATTGDGLMGGMVWIATQLRGLPKQTMFNSMSSFISSLYKRLSNTIWTQRPVLMIGPSGSGKTSILYQLYFSKPVVDINTYGFNLETITIDRMELTLWDIGGSLHNHTLRQHYAPGAVGIICVIDSSDETQFEDAKARLWGLYSLYGSLRRETVLLVFANKQDCLNSMSVKEMKDRLELETMAQGLRWHVQGCVATTGDGLTAGMTWMVTQLKGSR